MKFSVVVNSKGEVVAATVPMGSVSAAGSKVTTEMRTPEGHKAYEVSMPPELAKDFLEGNFSQSLQRYHLSHEGSKPVLKRK